MALKRFNGNPEYYYDTVGDTHELTDNDIIPFTHKPGTEDDEDGKVKLSELKKYMNTTQDGRLTAIEDKIPSNASTSNKLATSSNAVGSFALSIDSSTYVMTLQAKDVNGNNLGTAQTIDLPLETMVVSGSYDSTNKKIILTLKNGSTVEFSVADLVSGLQSTITGAATTITSSNLTASRALISDANGKVAVSDVTSTELGYLDGVTSNIQPQLNNVPYFGTVYSGGSYSSGYFEIARLEGAAISGNHDISVEGTVISDKVGTIKISDFFVYIRGNNATVQTTIFNCVGRHQNVDLTATYEVFDTNKYRIRLYAKIDSMYHRYNTYIKYVSSGDVSDRVSNRTVTFPNTYVTSVVGTEITKNVNYAGNITSATSATNATYATKIGTSSSHPAIGSTSTPVYIDSTGTPQACTSISPSTVDMANATGTLAIGHGGTGATTAANARTNLGLPFVTCSTAAATAAKATGLTGQTLAAGYRLCVKFTYENTAANPTLTVNGTNYTIYRYGTTSPTGSATYPTWRAGEVVEFVYDGTYFQMVSANAVSMRMNGSTLYIRF